MQWIINGSSMDHQWTINGLLIKSFNSRRFKKKKKNISLITSFVVIFLYEIFVKIPKIKKEI